MGFARFSKLSLLISAGLLVGTISTKAIANTNQIEIQHNAGITKIAENPKTSVVYDLALLDIMSSLGIKATGVPTSVIWPDFLKYYENEKKHPQVGTLFEPDYEAVFGLKPDLIMVAGRSAPKYKNLNKIAPTIDLTVNNNDLINSVKNNTLILANIYNKQDIAQAEIKQLDQALAKIQAKTKDAGNALLILTVGGKISAYGPGSRFGIIHDNFGFQPAAPDLEITNHGQAISFEFIHKTDPDWLFVIDRDAALGTGNNAAQSLLDNELIHKTKAWQKNQIVYLDSINWYILGSSGLNSLNANINEIITVLDK